MNIETFEVGEIAIGQALVYTTQFNGAECRVVGPLEIRKGKHPIAGAVPMLCYEVTWETGENLLVSPKNLRKKHPPKSQREIDTVVHWKDCAWSPHKEPVT